MVVYPPQTHKNTSLQSLFASPFRRLMAISVRRFAISAGVTDAYTSEASLADLLEFSRDLAGVLKLSIELEQQSFGCSRTLLERHILPKYMEAQPVAPLPLE